MCKKSAFHLFLFVLFIFLFASCSSNNISLRTVYMAPAPQVLTGTHIVNIEGELGGTGIILLDGNSCTIPNVFGDPEMCTRKGFIPIQITLEQMTVVDPAGKGRKVYELIGNFYTSNHKYYLVVPSSSNGDYRLVIHKTGMDQKWGVVSLEKK